MNIDQTIINWSFAVVGALGGFILKATWDALATMRKDMADLTAAINRDYVRRDDFKDHAQRVEAMLARIFQKLDDKADKP